MTDAIEKLVEQAARIIDAALYGQLYKMDAKEAGELVDAFDETPIAHAIVTLAYAAGRKAGREEAAKIADAEVAACNEDGCPSLEDWKSASSGIAAAIRALPEG